MMCHLSYTIISNFFLIVTAFLFFVGIYICFLKKSTYKLKPSCSGILHSSGNTSVAADKQILVKLMLHLPELLCLRVNIIRVGASAADDKQTS